MFRSAGNPNRITPKDTRITKAAKGTRALLEIFASFATSRSIFPMTLHAS
jgi:hypothetical protein